MPAAYQTVLSKSICLHIYSKLKAFLVTWETSLAGIKVNRLISHEAVSTYEFALFKETWLTWDRKLYKNAYLA